MRTVPGFRAPVVHFGCGGHPLAAVCDRTLTRALSGVPDSHTPRVPWARRRSFGRRLTLPGRAVPYPPCGDFVTRIRILMLGTSLLPGRASRGGAISLGDAISHRRCAQELGGCAYVLYQYGIPPKNGGGARKRGREVCGPRSLVGRDAQARVGHGRTQAQGRRLLPQAEPARSAYIPARCGASPRRMLIALVCCSSHGRNPPPYHGRI